MCNQEQVRRESIIVVWNLLNKDGLANFILHDLPEADYAYAPSMSMRYIEVKILLGVHMCIILVSLRRITAYKLITHASASAYVTGSLYSRACPTL